MSQLRQIASVKPHAAFLKRVNKAHETHLADIERAKADLAFECKVLQAHKLHWEACKRPTDTIHRVPELSREAIAHAKFEAFIAGLKSNQPVKPAPRKYTNDEMIAHLDAYMRRQRARIAKREAA